MMNQKFISRKQLTFAKAVFGLNFDVLGLDLQVDGLDLHDEGRDPGIGSDLDPVIGRDPVLDCDLDNDPVMGRDLETEILAAAVWGL